METTTAGVADTELVETGEQRDALGRRRTPAGRRAELLAAYRASGLTQRAFARREGIVSVAPGEAKRGQWLTINNGCGRGLVGVHGAPCSAGNLTATRTYDPQRDLLTGLQTQAGVGTGAPTVTQFDYAYE